MTHEQAQKILDKVREGVAYPAGVVDFALQLTGDLDAHEAHGSQGMGREIQTQGQTSWGRASQDMVERNHFGHRA
jgi:hypothetical protein